MKLLILFSLTIGVCWSQWQNNTAGKYVFDMYVNTPPLDPDAVVDLLIVAKPGETFPLLHSVPDTGFRCTNFKFPGYYADTAPGSRCQAFYRCEINGNQTGFLCPNSTLFNQLTLTCDYYFNVDCNGSSRFFDFGNSRLYQDKLPLFDTPPKGYISALSGLPQSGEISQPGSSSDNTGGATGETASLDSNQDANDLLASARESRRLNGTAPEVQPSNVTTTHSGSTDTDYDDETTAPPNANNATSSSSG